MALLRPCGRLGQAFFKLPTSCQVEYIRRLERVNRIQGYVTVTTKPGNSITKNDKLEVPGCKSNASDNIPTFNLANEMQRRLATLCLGVKSNGIQERDLLRIIDTYSGCHETNNSTALALLRCCGNRLLHVESANRRILTDQVWELVACDPSKLTVEHYNTLLIVHEQNNRSVDAKKFIDDMVVQPNSSTYRLLLKAVARSGDVDSTRYVVSRIKEEGHSLDREIFNSLILAHAMNSDAESALSELDNMKNSRIEPTGETYANLACGYASVGNFEDAMRIVKAHILDAAQITRIVERLSSSNLGKHIPEVLRHLKAPVIARTFADAVTELTQGGRPEDAFKVIDWLATVVSDEEMDAVYESFLDDLVGAKIPIEAVMKFLNTIMELDDRPTALVDVCAAALRSGQRELAMAIFEAMHERKIVVRPHYYWPLLVQSSRGFGETDVYRTVRHMLCLNVVMDYDTLFQYVIPFINTVEPQVTLRKLIDQGLDASVVCTPLISYLLTEGRINDAITLCSRTKTIMDFDRVFRSLLSAYRLTKNVNACAKILKFAPSGKYYAEEFLLTVIGKNPRGRRVNLLQEYLRAFEDNGISVTNLTIAKCRNDSNTNEHEELTLENPLKSALSHQGIPHPRDMTIEELECHLIELKSKRMNTRGVMRKLLQLNCRRNNLNRVEEVRKEYDDNGFTWTPGLYSSLLEIYVRNGRVDEALDLYAKIRDCKDFRMDDFKIIRLGTALVKAERIGEACALMESTSSTGGLRIVKDCWRILDAVAHSTNYELTESMLDILVGSGYCEINNTVLGPLVRVHLLKNDLAMAVDTFAKCADKHGHTPLRQELVFALVEASRINEDSTNDETSKLLEQVRIITEKHHGKAIVVLDMVVALARLGRTDELRKFLRNNRIPTNALSRNLTLVMETEKIPILTTLLDASAGISTVNRISIYEQLLSFHNFSGDCDAAIKLWKQMLAEEEIPSPSFKSVFLGLLTKHKVSLPENFPVTDVKLFEPRFDK